MISFACSTLLSKCSAWDEDLVAEAFSAHYTENYGEYDVEVVHSQKEISVISIEERAEKETNPPTANSVIPYLAFAIMSLGAVAILIKQRRKIFNY